MRTDIGPLSGQPRTQQQNGTSFADAGFSVGELICLPSHPTQWKTINLIMQRNNIWADDESIRTRCPATMRVPQSRIIMIAFRCGVWIRQSQVFVTSFGGV